MLRRYFTVVGIILVALIGLGFWLKPPIGQMREGVEDGLVEYAKAHLKPGETLPAVTHEESRDWIIATSHQAKVGDLAFSCWGAFKVTVCTTPKD